MFLISIVKFDKKSIQKAENLKIEMSHLLKRTKKSCIKIFRKISSTKQLFPRKLDEDDNNTTADNSTDALEHNNDLYIKWKEDEDPNETVDSNFLYSNNNNGSSSSSAHNHNHNQTSQPSTVTTHQYMEYEDDSRPPIAVPNANVSEPNSNSSNNSNKCKVTAIDSNQAIKRSSPKIFQKLKRKDSLKDDIPNYDTEMSPNHTILHKLTAKLFLTAEGYDFHRLQQLRSDTASEIVQFDENEIEETGIGIEAAPENMTKNNLTLTLDNDVDDVLDKAATAFEKVKYKEDIRYFRHTPSTSSLDNYRFENSSSMATTPDFNADDLYEMHDSNKRSSAWQTFEYHLKNSFSNACYQKQVNREQQASSSSSPPKKQHQQQQQNLKHYALCEEKFTQDVFLPKVNMSLGSKLNGYHQNLIISQERNHFSNKLTPSVKWDINGNSLDGENDVAVEDEDNILFPNENWEEFDNRINKSIAAAKAANEQNANFLAESPGSSMHSSSTTLETWIEDELLDNSFNEKLELTMNRCLIIT